ncbi:DUF6262 family protein [Streptosporangium sp. H16]|uniref:DUF6262 family protein n=1 Tax=Streptosporangium sp. H16 TaxID=3444184 RepID=UPI003F7A96B9
MPSDRPRSPEAPKTATNTTTITLTTGLQAPRCLSGVFRPSPDNTHYLRSAEQQRRTRLIEQAQQAIRRLDTAGEAITVAAVVRASGTSRAFLYRIPELIQEIQRLRDLQQRSDQRQPVRQRMTDSSKEARIRQLTATNGELRAEIQRLRTQNALLLGHLREQPTIHHLDRPPRQVD